MTSENIGWDALRVDLLWDLKARPRRGPKPTLTVEQIARAGIEIADREGLAAVSMQRIAEGLGVGTMSLYTYVPDKASVLEVMLDAAFEEVVVPGRSGRNWRSYLEAGAEAILTAYEKHPWALQIFVGGPPLGPHQLRFLEAALQALSDTDLDDEEKLQVVMSVSAYTRGAAHISVGITQNAALSGISDEQLQAAYREAYARVLDPKDFPMTTRLLTSPGLSEEPPVESHPPGPGDPFGFRFGLSRLLDGVERHMESDRRS